MEKLSPGCLSGISGNNDPQSKSKDNVPKVYTIAEITQIVNPIAVRYGVASLWLFGSYARGEATVDSDVDLLIDGGEIHTLWQLTAFRLDVEDALGKSVDVVTLGIDDLAFLNNIRREEVPLYSGA